MPLFMAIDRVDEPIHGVTLRLPMATGNYTNVSEDEAAILRQFPRQFTEVPAGANPRHWRPTPERNRMVSGTEVTKDAAPVQAGGPNEPGE
jgi:hypothetical protein